MVKMVSDELYNETTHSRVFIDFELFQNPALENQRFCDSHQALKPFSEKKWKKILMPDKNHRIIDQKIT